MSVEALTWASKQTTGSPGAKLVLMVLADYADADWYCFPGQKKIAEISEQSERTVRTHLKALESGGLIVREYRAREDGTRTSDGYYLGNHRQ